MKILVTDGDARSTLAATRSLGRMDHIVIVTGPIRGNLAACSRYCSRSYPTADPLKDGEKFSQDIRSIAAQEKIDVIIPMTEQSIYHLNQCRESLPASTLLACAPTEMMNAISDKYRLFQLAERIGVPMPKTVFIESLEDFHSKSFSFDFFPVVVKPALSKTPHGNILLSSTVMHAVNQDELHRLYETKPVLQYPSLIQEMITGEGTGLFTLFDIDHHLALFSHQRLLEKPPSGGVSVLSQSVALDPEMVEASRRLLASVGWKGVAMVEFKRDIRDQTAKLIEINGRFWGTLQLAISSGINFPALYIDYCYGTHSTELLTNYRTGHILKWPLGLLDHLFIRIKRRKELGNLDLKIPKGRQLWNLLLFGGLNGISYDVLEFQDLGPFWMELKNYIKQSPNNNQ